MVNITPPITLTTIQGLLPENKELLSSFTPYRIDCISRFLSIIRYSGDKEYEKQFHSDQLRILFGSDYLNSIQTLENLGIIKWIKHESKYNSAVAPKQHNSFLIGEGIKLKKHNIRTYKGIKACKRRNEVKSTSKALKKAKKHLESTLIHGTESENLNYLLSQGLVEVTQDNYGFRIYSKLTQMESDLRPSIYHKRKPHLKNCEIDIKASHPYLWVMLVNSSKPFKKMLPRHFHPVLSKFESIGEQEKEKWMSMYFNGDFYENFAKLFEGTNWKEKIDEFKTKKGMNLPETEREYAKNAFMYIFNGKKVCLLNLIKPHFPESVAALLEAFEVEIMQLYKEIPDGVNREYDLKKGYRKYKNLSIIFTRVESHCMQTAYSCLKSWGHLIHDSILVMKDQEGQCYEAIEKSYDKHFIRLPKIETE